MILLTTYCLLYVFVLFYLMIVYTYYKRSKPHSIESISAGFPIIYSFKSLNQVFEIGLLPIGGSLKFYDNYIKFRSVKDHQKDLLLNGIIQLIVFIFTIIIFSVKQLDLESIISYITIQQTISELLSTVSVESIFIPFLIIQFGSTIISLMILPIKLLFIKTNLISVTLELLNIATYVFIIIRVIISYVM